MKLQGVIIPEAEGCTELYYRGGLTLSAGGALSFDAYFNCFDYTKYRKYTEVGEVRFACSFKGSARVELCVYDGAESVICGGEFSGRAELCAQLAGLPERGILYPRITALTDVRFESGEYTADCAGREISCCAAICTYKRESYVTKNARALRDFGFSRISRAFIIDNGNTLDCAALSDDFIRVLPNRNYGGSGGFTRGLIEALDGGFSHVILMDDDVEFHPEVLERMTVFVSLLRGEYLNAHFSAAMLSADRPYIQYELGAGWNGQGAPENERFQLDVRGRDALLKNITDEKIGYGAWWCFLMPVSDIEEYGLPYPLFIKIDDVEYGLRTCREAPIVIMNGVAVRHDDFDNKYSLALEYYYVRNRLAVNTMLGLRPLYNAVYRLMASSLKALILYRYDVVPLILQGVDDFLKGVDFFLGCDEEKLNGEIMRRAPKLVRLSEIDGWSEEMRGLARGRDYKILTPACVFSLAGHIFPPFMLKKEIGAAPLSKAACTDTLRRRAVIQYQLGDDMGILTTRSAAKFFKYSFLTLGRLIRLLFCFGRVKRDYQSRKGEISSVEFWRGHLGLK